MIAYYESSAKNPTIEVIENSSKALGVKISTLLDDLEPVKRGPKSKLQQLTERLSELPRSKQTAVIEMLEGYL
jgi:transcriptional regulator with XRE-family HTH domain